MSDAQPNVVEFSVSELSQAVKRAIEDGFGWVRVRGEVSGWRGAHSSGHAYFSLKDANAKIDAVIWRGSFLKLKFKPQEGLEVVATGRLTTFPGSSKYQIVIENLEPAGIGALMALLEERKKQLAAEGLFDPARKRTLPRLPKVVGVVTSPTGAVIRDILHRISDRFPVRVIVWPVRVQGETSAREVADAIEGFGALPADGSGPTPRPDVLIVARGGGSLEDLWSFNEEIVVRAAAASPIPLVSAIGHETDWTLIDLASDLRAPTPTGAAEMVVPVRADLLDQVESLGGRLGGAVRRSLEAKRAELRSAGRALPSARAMIETARQRLDIAGGRLGRALDAATRVHATRFARVSGRLSPGLVTQRIGREGERLRLLGDRADRAVRLVVQRRADRLAGLAQVLSALSYRSVLARGFALVRDPGGRALASAAAAAASGALVLEFADGRIAARTEAGDTPAPTTPASTTPAEPNRRSAKPRRKADPPPSQGSLF
ncbi:MAG: exodeoxyribonuclease VII large subunit [Hyphomicrobiales bacterium]|nr:exodeoxyribonuclease VII large subunit [Hyphomicrobiales bacterium]